MLMNLSNFFSVTNLSLTKYLLGSFVLFLSKKIISNDHKGPLLDGRVLRNRINVAITLMLRQLAVL